jgi:tRNASer (uridine44-2'-O)-methyltransferase
MPGRRKGWEQPLLPLTESSLTTTATPWLTSPSYQQTNLPFSATAFHSVTDALLENPNLNSSHLFRADIISDSTGILKTNKEKEDYCRTEPFRPDWSRKRRESGCTDEDDALRPLSITGFELRRTVLRRLMPRKPLLDRSLLQTCHIYTSSEAHVEESDQTVSNDEGCRHDLDRLSFDEKSNNRSIYKQCITHRSKHLLVYQPHVDPVTGSDMPWYHPPLKILAFLYDCNSPLDIAADSEEEKQLGSTLSIHFQFFQEKSSPDSHSSITTRLHRTLLSLSSTFVRLARNTPVSLDDTNGEQIAKPISATQHIKDNIIPEHLVQNTYSRLKTLYGSDLINRWVEKTDPSKHVFEDLSIAAFLMELWEKMYGCNPSDFPGFVDMACGNGVLVYVLIMEGFSGWGFDARVRRTWSIFPEIVTAHLKETVCIPRPFLEALRSQAYSLPDDLQIHDGIFGADTFIISNHADELTMWTPLLAALSCPESPLPWLAIPCCSHALSGAAHRYHSPTPRRNGLDAERDRERLQHGSCRGVECQEQPATGDLVALRALRNQTAECLKQGQSSGTNSTYASLVNKVMSLGSELDPTEDVQQTLMRIPSTRNIGIVGGQWRHLRFRGAEASKSNHDMSSPTQLKKVKRAELTKQTHDVVEEECAVSGGVVEAANIWMRGVQKARGATRHAFHSG